MPSKLSHLLPANYPISISDTLSTTIFCHRGHYFFSLSPTESCFPLTFAWAPHACWGTRRMPIVMFLCNKGVSCYSWFSVCQIIQELFQDQNWAENPLILLSWHMFDAVVLPSAVRSSIICSQSCSQLWIFEYYHEFPLYSITCEFRWAKSLNAAQILLYVCWSFMCLPIFKLYHKPLLHATMNEFRWAKFLNAAQILLYACKSSMCLWMFELYHKPLLHSIMCEFKWAKFLNAANNYGNSLQISFPVKLFSPTIHYTYSCTYRWRKCDWLTHGAVVHLWRGYME